MSQQNPTPRNEREANTAMADSCCTGNCNQGRDCPEREPSRLRLSAEVFGLVVLTAAFWGLVVVAAILSVRGCGQ